MEAIDDAFTTETGIAVELNTVDHGTFQDQITNYLGATPDTVYTWFSGFRMKFFADQGLNTAIDDVWAKVKGNYTRASRTRSSATTARSTASRSTTTRGRSSIARASSPRRATRSRRRGTSSSPCARRCRRTASRRSRSATRTAGRRMGTFDILNLRLNGYDFHVGLMAGKEKWTDPKVTAVFQKWAEILPLPRQGLRRPDLAERGRHARPEEVRHVPARPVRLGAVRGDQGPGRPRRTSTSSRSRTWAPQFDAEKALDAPIDTIQISAKSPKLAAELDAAKAYLEFWSKGSTQLIMFKNQPGLIPTAKDADTSRLQRPPEEGRGDRQQGPEDHPVPRPRHALRLRRRERHAEPPPEVPRRTRTRTWPPTRSPSRTSGISFRRSSDDSYPDAMSGTPIRHRTIRPAGPPDRRGGSRLPAPQGPLLAPDAPGQADPGPDGRHPDLPVPVLHLAADARVDRAVVHELARDRRRSPRNNIVGLKNYEVLFTQYPLFWPAVLHNVIWLLFLVFIATPIGIFLAVLLDREMRGTRIYQSAFYIPVVLSLAIVGFIWQQMYTSQGFINSVLGHTELGHRDRLAGQPVAQPLGGPRRRELAPRRLRDGPLPGRAEERRPDAA